MLAELILVDFNYMHRRLQQRRMMAIDKVENDLIDVRTFIRAIQTIRASGLAERQELKTLWTTLSAESYIRKAFELIKPEMPLVDDYEADEPGDNDDGGENQSLLPGLIGLNAYTWDDVSELCENPYGCNSMDVFLILILSQMQSDVPDEYWTRARETFGWPEFEPVMVRQKYSESDLNKARTYLEAHDSIDLTGAIEVGFFAPENVFYSANMEDGSWEPYEDTTDNLAWLIAEWAEAKPFYERSGIARAAIERNPERLLVLIEAMKAAGMIFNVEEEFRNRGCGMML